MYRTQLNVSFNGADYQIKGSSIRTSIYLLDTQIKGINNILSMRVKKLSYSENESEVNIEMNLMGSMR